MEEKMAFLWGKILNYIKKFSKLSFCCVQMEERALTDSVIVLAAPQPCRLSSGKGVLHQRGVMYSTLNRSFLGGRGLPLICCILKCPVAALRVCINTHKRVFILFSAFCRSLQQLKKEGRQEKIPVDMQKHCSSRG